MCTAFVRRGNDVICGFNMDINIGAFDYDIYAERDAFYVGMKVPKSDIVVRIHGVNSKGYFANQLNNMDFHKSPYKKGKDNVSLDYLIHRFLLGELDFYSLKKIAEEKKITQMQTGILDMPTIAFHSLITDCTDKIMILEPGNGFSVITDKYAVLSNFSLLELPENLDDEHRSYYGKDRYDIAMRHLRNSTDDFSVEDGLRILQDVKQTGNWATRVSFVYSRNNNTVYYCLDGQFNQIEQHMLYS